ncbi:hypothetical protein LUX39_33235 [Actinomadura madurae]|nr:hypothetical protein [Actinomadura madurae]MCP9952603.1 hypothetical protein [Actinomadura madurae]MCQ0018053.1 hypothetical protein [Actinomadura madurae]
MARTPGDLAGDQGDALPGGDQGQQHEGVLRQMPDRGREPRRRAAAQHGVDHALPDAALVGDERLVRQLGQIDLRTAVAHEPVAGREGGDEHVRADVLELQPRIDVPRRAQETAVDAAVMEAGDLVAGVHLVQPQLQPGMEQDELVEHARQQAEGHRLHIAEGQLPEDAARRGLRHLHRAFQPGHDDVDLGQERPSRGRQLDVAGVPPEQLDAERALQRLDVAGEGRLGAVEPRRRPPEVQLGRHGLEGPHLLDGRILSHPGIETGICGNRQSFRW